MKKIFLSAVSLIALAAPAAAADLSTRTYTKAPPAYVAPTPVYNWTGFYVGGNVGGAFGGDAFNSDGRFMGGVQGGADYQFSPNWLVGLEAQYDWTGNNSDSFAFPGGFVSRDNSGLGSVTGRLGYVFGPALLYAKGGYAFTGGNNNLGVSYLGAPSSFVADKNNTSGYTVGAGLEYMFAPNWSVKGEYQYYDFGRTTFLAGSPPPLVGTSFRNDDHTFKIGINYRFGGTTPVSARY